MLRLLITFGIVLLAGGTQVTGGHQEANPYDDVLWQKVASIDLDSSMYFDVTPTLLSSSGEWVTVYWSGVSSPSSKDWIGVYSPPASNGYGINTTRSAPIKYKYASSSSTHTSSGSGQLELRLINMRDKVVFGFFQGSSLKAVSSVVEFSNYNEPLQGHLALTSDTTSMSIMWVTKEALSPGVMWGTESESYEATSDAETKTYSASNMCGTPATGYGYRDPGLIHSATMTDLEPGITYYYSFGDDEYGWSPQYSFKAPPDSSSTITVIAFGDMGVAEPDGSYLVETSKYSLNTTSRIKDQLNSLDIVLQIGDISYALGYSSMWDVYFDQIEQIATSVPFMVAIGNHERNWPYTSPGTFNNSGSGGECGIPHEMRFPMPTPARDSPWYSFDYGSAHFLVMSTEHSFQKGSSQYSFIYSDLKSVNKTKTPWIIFAGHRPMYAASQDSNYPDGHTVVAQSLRYALEPLFLSYGVDLALWAHIHGYQRTCSAYQGSCYSSGSSSSSSKKGTTHVVVGMAGRSLHNNIIPSSIPSWLVYYDTQNYGYSRMMINATHLVFQYIHNYDNKVYDSFVLKKNTK